MKKDMLREAMEHASKNRFPMCIECTGEMHGVQSPLFLALEILEMHARMIGKNISLFVEPGFSFRHDVIVDQGCTSSINVAVAWSSTAFKDVLLSCMNDSIDVVIFDNRVRNHGESRQFKRMFIENVMVTALRRYKKWLFIASTGREFSRLANLQVSFESPDASHVVVAVPRLSYTDTDTAVWNDNATVVKMDEAKVAPAMKKIVMEIQLGMVKI